LREAVGIIRQLLRGHNFKQSNYIRMCSKSCDIPI
jgi:hypothetical protein